MRARTVVLLALAGLALAAGCGAPLGLPRASYENKVKTVSLYALSGTPVSFPSAYSLLFDSIKVAPTSRYQRDSAVVVDSNTVAILHSIPSQCSFGLPNQVYYAKLHVLAIDTTSGPNGRRIDFEILTDINCGYRGLAPGVPKI